MIRRMAVWALLAGLLALWAYSDQIFPPEVIRAETAIVRDGDTLVLDGETYRLVGMDAPEYRQICKDSAGKDWPCGKAARLQLAAFVASGSLTCMPQAEDKYGRKVARCSSATVPDLSEAMVQVGLAISPAERGSAVYEEAEDEAKRAKRGLWQGVFDPPADWRATHPR